MTLIPALILILGAFALPLLPKTLRDPVSVALPLATLAAIWYVPADVDLVVRFASFNLQPLHLHPYTHIFATVFCLAASIGGLFALNNRNVYELTAAYVYAGAAIGVTFAGDFITLFLYWEVMAIASALVIVAAGTASARATGLRYAIMHFLGGIILLIGIIALGYSTDELSIRALTDLAAAFIYDGDQSLPAIGAVLILVGVLVNAGAPPFSSWLPDAYPEASYSGAVFLSAFTTKTAVFVLLTLFAGLDILVYVGVFMIFYGIIYAMLEYDARRILSYSVINQVGFMVTGIGIGTTLAQYGVASHAFCHIIYKALLFMSAGSVFYMTKRRKCSELGGLWYTMPITTFAGIIGALAISAFPLTSGFVSKSLISGAAAREELMIVWYLLVAASAGVFLHAGIKFPWFVFFQKDSGLRPDDPPKPQQIAMLLFVAMCILPGLFPSTLYSLLPGDPPYNTYTPDHIVTQLQLLLYAGLAFFVMLPWLQRTNTLSLDLDWIWRVPVKRLLLMIQSLGDYLLNRIKTLGVGSYRGIAALVSAYHGPGKPLEQNLEISRTLLYTVSVLTATLALFYIFGL